MRDDHRSRFRMAHAEPEMSDADDSAEAFIRRPSLLIAEVVNSMQSQVADDLKGEGEAHTRLIVEEMSAMRLKIEALGARATS